MRPRFVSLQPVYLWDNGTKEGRAGGYCINRFPRNNRCNLELPISGWNGSKRFGFVWVLCIHFPFRLIPLWIFNFRGHAYAWCRCRAVTFIVFADATTLHFLSGGTLEPVHGTRHTPTEVSKNQFFHPSYDHRSSASIGVSSIFGPVGALPVACVLSLANRGCGTDLTEWFARWKWLGKQPTARIAVGGQDLFFFVVVCYPA